MNAVFLKNKNSVIYGRYAFVVLSYIILFAVLLFFSKIYLILMGKDTHLDNSVLFLSLSFLCFLLLLVFK